MSFQLLTSVVVPAQCVQETHEHLRSVGSRGLEGLALWAGRRTDESFHVEQAIIPLQRGVRSVNGVYVEIGPQELHRMNVWLFERKLSLIAQIHSHPTEAYHSDTDDAYALVTKAGAISIVVPDFARQTFSLTSCATFRLSDKGRWVELSPAAAKNLIRIGA